MTKILCNYNDATVKCLDMFTSGMVGAQISFEFAEEWEGLTKTAVFSAGDVQRDVLIVDSNVITIPWEVLQHAKEQLIVGVYGTNGTELVIPTVYAGLGRIKTGADPSGDPGIPPTPSILDQVLTAASESLANAQRSEEKADEAEASAKAAAESEANVQAMFDRMGDIPVVSATEFDADAETVIHRSSLVNLKTGATDTEEAPLPVANTQQAGVMTAETVQAIMDLTAAVSTLSGQNIRLSYTAGATPTAAEIQSFVISKGYTDQTRWEYIAVVVKADNHVWRYYTGTGWQDDGIDTVSVATEYIMGVVLGSSTDGKVYVEADGTMSVNGYDAIISTLENLSTGKADDNAVYHEWRLGYNATAQTITKDGAAVPFADVYSAVEDKTKFVYVEWANRVYIPQYVSSGLIYFMCAYIDSGLIKLERIMFDAATGKALTGSLSTYDKAKIDELLRAKANSSEVYTKTEIDAKETELKETFNPVINADKTATAGKVWTATEDGAEWKDAQGGGGGDGWETVYDEDWNENREFHATSYDFATGIYTFPDGTFSDPVGTSLIVYIVPNIGYSLRFTNTEINPNWYNLIVDSDHEAHLSATLSFDVSRLHFESPSLFRITGLNAKKLKIHIEAQMSKFPASVQGGKLFYGFNTNYYQDIISGYNAFLARFLICNVEVEAIGDNTMIGKMDASYLAQSSTSTLHNKYTQFNVPMYSIKTTANPTQVYNASGDRIDTLVSSITPWLPAVSNFLPIYNGSHIRVERLVE